MIYFICSTVAQLSRTMHGTCRQGHTHPFNDTTCHGLHAFKAIHDNSTALDLSSSSNPTHDACSCAPVHPHAPCAVPPSFGPWAESGTACLGA